MRLVLSLFTMLLALAATLILAKGIIPDISAWVGARTWVEVKAELVGHELRVTKVENTDSDGSPRIDSEYSLHLHYQYDYAGQRYKGSTLSLSSIELSERALIAYNNELESIARDHEALSVWVDPDKPNRSVLDRSFNWLGFSMMLNLFVGMGVLGYSGLYEILRSIVFFVTPVQFAKLRAVAETEGIGPNVVYDRESAAAPIGWGLLFFCASLINIGFILALDALVYGNVGGLIAIILGGTFIGIIFYAALKVRRKTINLGAITLHLSRYPVSTGSSILGFCDIPKNKLPASSTIRFRFGCDQHDHRTSEVNRRTLWKDMQSASISMQGRCKRAHFDFLIPGNLPSAESDKQVTINWWLELIVSAPGADSQVKRYDNLAVFQMDQQKEAARNLRLKKNATTRPGWASYSTVFLTNGILVAGATFLDWSMDTVVLMMLAETVLLALVTPIFSIMLFVHSDKNENGGPVLLFSLPVWYLIVAAYTVTQLFILEVFYGLEAGQLLRDESGVLAGVLKILDVYKLWIPLSIVLVSIFYEWWKVLSKREDAQYELIMKRIQFSPVIRMFILFGLLVVASFLVAFFEQSARLHNLVLLIVAFKIWVEFSLVRWGRLEL